MQKVGRHAGAMGPSYTEYVVHGIHIIHHVINSEQRLITDYQSVE